MAVTLHVLTLIGTRKDTVMIVEDNQWVLETAEWKVPTSRIVFGGSCLRRYLMATNIWSSGRCVWQTGGCCNRSL